MANWDVYRQHLDTAAYDLVASDVEGDPRDVAAQFRTSDLSTATMVVRHGSAPVVHAIVADARLLQQNVDIGIDRARAVIRRLGWAIG